MAGLSKIIDVHSHPILPFGEGAPVGEGQKQPDWSVESALSYMEVNGISACVLSSPASANDATGQEARDIARRTNEFLAEIVSKHPKRFGAVATLPALDADGALSYLRASIFQVFCGSSGAIFTFRLNQNLPNFRHRTLELTIEQQSKIISVKAFDETDSIMNDIQVDASDHRTQDISMSPPVPPSGPAECESRHRNLLHKDIDRQE
jgi:hypothetical protein